MKSAWLGGLLVLLLLAACQSNTSDSSPDSLAARYKRLSCAVVQIVSNKEAGTGVFTDVNGTLVTAAHVLFKVTWVTNDKGDPVPTLSELPQLRLVTVDGIVHFFDVDPNNEDNILNAGFDLARVKIYGLPPTCSISLSDDKDYPPVGSHVIGIGYPGYSFGSQILDEGFVSGIFPTQLSPEAFIGTTPVVRAFPLVQFHLTGIPGTSGAPIISDHDQVIAISGANPLSFPKRLGQMINSYDPQKDRQEGISSPSATPDLKMALQMLGALGWTDQEYLSTGSALAVPVFWFGSSVPAARLVKPEAEPNQK
jgi:hypothetical protein